MSNQLKIEILNRVRHLLVTQKVTYICTALNHPEPDASPEYITAANELNQWLKSMLTPHHFLENWLIQNNHVAFQDFNKFTDLSTDYPERIRATRIAWVDWMISQLSLH